MVTERANALSVASWNADEVRCRKPELEYFLNQHGVDICLLSETLLNIFRPSGLAKYVGHRRGRLTAGAVSHPGPP